MNNSVHVTEPSEDLGYTDLIAVEMVSAYELNMGWMYGEPYLSQNGMEELADLFEEVPIPLKAIVFGKFLSELEARGIKYNKEEWKRPH